MLHLEGSTGGDVRRCCFHLENISIFLNRWTENVTHRRIRADTQYLSILSRSVLVQLGHRPYYTSTAFDSWLQNLVLLVETTSDAVKLVKKTLTYILGPLCHIWHPAAREPMPLVLISRDYLQQTGSIARIVKFVPSDEPAGV